MARKGKSDLQQKNTHKKNGNQHSTLHIRISLGTNIQLKMTILIFWTKFAQKGYIQLKTEKANLTIKFCRFESLYVPNFSLNWQFWFFGPNLPKNFISGQKKRKVSIINEFCILELVNVPNFTLNNFDFLEQIWPKRVFPVESGKVNTIIEFCRDT